MYSFALFAWLFAGPQRCARGFPWLAVEGFAACRKQRRSQQSSPGASAAFPVAAAPPGRWHRARALAAGQPATARAAAAAGPCPRRPAGKPASLTNGGKKEQLLHHCASTTRRAFRLRANKKQTEKLRRRTAKPSTTWNFSFRH